MQYKRASRGLGRTSSLTFLCRLAILVATEVILLTHTLHMAVTTQPGDIAPTTVTPPPLVEKSTNATVSFLESAKPHSQPSFQAVPHRIFFTYKINILETKEPIEYYENVQNTIRAYRDLWNEAEAPVEFLDDATCRHYVELAYPDLLPHFDREEHGAYKGDICRIAALYLKGGYYFDVDIRVLEPVPIASNVTFSTAVSGSGLFFQAWLAASPRHPVLSQAFEEMMAHYEEIDVATDTLMGCDTLTKAYDAVDVVDRGEVLMLEEIWLLLRPFTYRDLPRQSGRGISCNCIVHDPVIKKVYFYSRIVGSSNCLHPYLKGKRVGSAVTAPMVPLTPWR